MPTRSILTAASMLTMPAVILAQAPVLPRIERSRQVVGPLVEFDQAGQITGPGGTADTEGPQDDAFGRQAILKRSEKPQPFTSFAEIGAFVTSNVALTNAGEIQDNFIVATAGAAFTQRFAFNTRFEVSARASAYRHDRVPELDFQSTDLAAGVTWTPPQLRGAEVLLRYTFTDLTTAERVREFYKNHAILLGVQKVVPFCRAQAAYVGISAQWSFADPKPAGRDEYAAYAGYRAQLTRHIDADLFYRYGIFVYRSGQGRRDQNHALSLAFHYTPKDWLTFSATGFYSANRSNRPVFDYDVGNAGVGLQVAMKF